MLLALLAAMLLTGCDASEPPPPASDAAAIARVADGDSLVLEGGERVRLLQIDAPELGSGECYGHDALRELERLLTRGDRARLEPDAALDDRDRHGRLLRYVHHESENVNVELVRRGAATPFFLGGERGRYADELLAAVDEARSSRAGMWRACHVRWRADRQVETRPR